MIGRIRREMLHEQACVYSNQDAWAEIAEQTDEETDAVTVIEGWLPGKSLGTEFADSWNDPGGRV